MVAIDLAGDAATGSFRSSMETLSGKTDLEILANGGIDETWIGVLDSLPVNATLRPDDRSAGLRRRRRQHSDLWGGSGAGRVAWILATDGRWPSRRRWPRRLHLARGASIAVAIGGQPIGGSHSPTSSTQARRSFVALDIADAQQLLGRYGKLDRIDVTVAPREDFARVEAAVRAALPAAT